MFVSGIGSVQGVEQSAQGVDEGSDLLSTHRRVPENLLIERGDTALCNLFLTEYLAGPGSDKLWIGPGLERLAVGREFAVLLGEHSSGHFDFGVV
ncbi:hypothetical protein ACFWBG_11545 [Nocardia salmonicida]|uniref:hypothetical protein n=1 Tax=Nocardia salmonicida TaxID=53431 RepID=UPI0036722C23